MHPISMHIMEYLIMRHVENYANCLDVGAFNVNGSYRDFIDDSKYFGLDIAAGPGVDFVVGPDSEWNLPMQFDLVISGQCLEHCEHPWLILEEMGKACKIGGTCLLIAPHVIPIHRYPIDCYRYCPDGMKALLKWGGFEPVESDVVLAQEKPCLMVDCYGVGVKKRTATNR